MAERVISVDICSSWSCDSSLESASKTTLNGVKCRYICPAFERWLANMSDFGTLPENWELECQMYGYPYHQTYWTNTCGRLLLWKLFESGRQWANTRSDVADVSWAVSDSARYITIETICNIAEICHRPQRIISFDMWISWSCDNSLESASKTTLNGVKCRYIGRTT